MFKNYIGKLKVSKDKKNLLANIFSLSLLQGGNYILPLLTIPYLIRVLGLDYFGLLAFATATILYIALITDYGFNLSATRQISIHRDNHNKVSEIFSSIMVIKIILMLAGFAFLVILNIFVTKFGQNWEVYIATFGIVIGQVLFPIWLFQGIEKMKFITYINIISKIFSTILIFIFVQDQSEYLLVPIFISLGFIFGGIQSLYIVIYKLGYKFVWPSYDEILLHLKDGWYFFYSSFAISLYTISTTFILGLLTNNMIVGQFSAVDKIIQAAKGLYQPVAQAIYPMMSKLFDEDKFLALKFLRKLAIIILLIMSSLSVCLYIFSKEIIILFIGSNYDNSITLLKIMSPLPLIITMSNILGIQIMLNVGLKSSFGIILTIAAVLGVTLSFLLIPLYQDIGTAYVVLIVEIFVTIAMSVSIRKFFKFNTNP
jgi:PST family polysaccharide transporter